MQDPVVGKIIMILWSIWRERNERFWNNIVRPLNVVAFARLECLYEWVQAKDFPGVSRDTSAPFGCMLWHPPLLSFIKYNCDAVIFQDRAKIGICIALQDKDGNLLAYKMLHFLGIPTIKETEVVALFPVVSWIHELGYTQVIFESDSQLVVKALQCTIYKDTEFGVILECCHLLLVSELHFNVDHVRRFANRVAYALARQSYLVQNPTVGFTLLISWVMF
ncbi:hypothetical protein PTKIN_Ptkin02bG0013700 [Pterospermum kingtungense]